MKAVHGMIMIVMMLLSIMLPQVQTATVARAQAKYEISKAGYEQWLSDNASRSVKCPLDDSKGVDKLNMQFCQCVSWVVWRLLQSGVSEKDISDLKLGNAGEWAAKADKKTMTVIDDATTRQWESAIKARWANVNGGVTRFTFLSFGSNAPLVLEIAYQNGGGHVMIVESRTNSVLKLTDFNGAKTGDYDSFQLTRLLITPPPVNDLRNVAWAGIVSWTGTGAKHFQMCDSSFRNCLVNEPVSGYSYRAKNEAWARIQRGNYCARVGESSDGPWSDAVCFTVDNTVTTFGGGLFRISVAEDRNYRSLDVKDRMNKDGQDVQIWELKNGGGSNQKWRLEPRGDGFYAIRPSSSFSNRCLDVSGNSPDNSRKLQIWNCHYGANQQFRVVDMGRGRYVIVARHSGKVLDVRGANIKNGTSVQQWNIHGERNQLWEIVSVR